MKKVFLFGLMCLAALTMQAQRCAVLEFKAGVGISQADVDGISAIFITYFQPAGYTMVERSQINKAIEEQRFQRSSMTESQMVRIGQILNVSKIVVGDVNIVMGQYNVDARVINVETGTVSATEGATFAKGTSYRATMQNLAQKLAGKIAISIGTPVLPPNPSTPTKHEQPTEPYIIYDYLKVFPNNLGTFDSEPKTIIARLNQTQQYGYGSWRLPTNEEINLLRANNVIGSGEYMTKETKNKSGIVRLVTDLDKGQMAPVVPEGYVDLGLPSGTMWKDKNEDGVFYSYNESMKKFGSKLPSKEQLEELKSVCKWDWIGDGYKVTGPSGDSILIPATGFCDCYGNVSEVGYFGRYWSVTPGVSGYSWNLKFDSERVGMDHTDCCAGGSIRLVQIP